MKIKFSHRYYKMPELVDQLKTYLVGVSVCDLEKLPIEFMTYDTIFPGGSYPLPNKGKYMVLTLHTGCRTWTTIRRWTPVKYDYYVSNLGRKAEIVIEEQR